MIVAKVESLNPVMLRHFLSSITPIKGAVNNKKNDDIARHKLNQTSLIPQSTTIHWLKYKKNAI